MTVETASFFSQFNASYPAATDLLSEGDNHLRLIKAVCQSQFTNLGAVAVTTTAAELNYSVGVTSAIQPQFTALTAAVNTGIGTVARWVSGTGYTVGTVVYSPLNFQNYRAKATIVSSTTDPSLDPTNWQVLGSTLTRSTITTNTAAVAGTIYDMTAALNLTLPAAPNDGDIIGGEKLTSVNNTVNVLSNGKTIAGQPAGTFPIGPQGFFFLLQYVAAAGDWRRIA